MNGLINRDNGAGDAQDDGAPVEPWLERLYDGRHIAYQCRKVARGYQTTKRNDDPKKHRGAPRMLVEYLDKFSEGFNGGRDDMKTNRHLALREWLLELGMAELRPHAGVIATASTADAFVPVASTSSAVDRRRSSLVVSSFRDQPTLVPLQFFRTNEHSARRSWRQIQTMKSTSIPKRRHLQHAHNAMVPAEMHLRTRTLGILRKVEIAELPGNATSCGYFQG